MAHPIWPLFDLRVRTPLLELRYVDDELGAALALLAAQGIHDPAWMPFGFPWTDRPSPELERGALQYYWRTRHETTTTHWDIPFAALVDGQLVGTTSLLAENFPTLRQFETGSWLGREFQGRGIGKELRQAALHLGFAGLCGTLATTAAFTDNGPSLGVTRHLGYREVGVQRRVRREEFAETLIFHMTADDWQSRLRRDDITIDGIEPVRDLLGLAGQ